MTTDRDHVWERSDVGITDRKSQVGKGGGRGKENSRRVLKEERKKI